jgi:uncharacterized protein (TIGR03437 family)
MPPNTIVDYDYVNKTPVASDIEDWTPAGTGVKKDVSVDTWTSIRYAWPDNIPAEQPDAWWYLYWMQSMPGAGNAIAHSDGRVMTNWWELTADWDAAFRARVGLHQPTGGAVLSAREVSVQADGSTGTITVNAPHAWIAVSNASWIQITAVSVTSVSYRVLSNASVDSRVASIVVAGTPVPVTQGGRSCSISMLPPRSPIAPSAGEVTVSVSVSPADCAWTARTNAPWLSVVGAPTRMGSAGLVLNAAPNPSSTERTARLSIGDQTVSITQMPGVNPVVITAVEHGASFQQTVCANCWISIRGSDLSASTRSWRAADFNLLRMPTSLDGVTVTFDGAPAYVSYISPTQVNVLSPVRIASAGTRVRVELSNSRGRSNAFTVPVGEAAHEFFTAVDRAGVVRPAAVHNDGTLVAPVGAYGPAVVSRPARTGDTVLFFGTGFGDTTPAITEGTMPAGPAPLVAPDSVRVEIGGVAANVVFAGLVGPGLYQLNVVVPVVNGPDAVVKATISGISSTAAPRLAVSE